MLSKQKMKSQWTVFGDLQTCCVQPNLVRIKSSVWISTYYDKGEEGLIEFDTRSNQIINIIKYPRALKCAGHSLCAHKEIIYIIDGQNGEIWSFDPTAEANLMFVKKSDIPTLGPLTNCFVREDRIHLMNGVHNKENRTFIYDILSNRFAKANAVDGYLKIGQSVAFKDDQCIRIGGCDVNFTKWSKLCSVGKINQFGIDWGRDMHLLPVGLAGCGLLWYKEFVLVFGGRIGTSSWSDAIYFYDTNNKAPWKKVENLRCPLKCTCIAHLFDENVHLIAQVSATKGKHFMIAMTAIMNQIKAENEEYDEKECDELNERNKTLQSENASLLVQLESAQRENDEIKKELNASRNEIMKMREQLKEFRILSIDQSNYLGWSGDEFVDWICGLDDGAFKQYEEKLRSTFKEEEISGSAIPYLQKEEWKGFGVKNYMHRTLIQAHVEELKQNQNKNDSNYNGEGKNSKKLFSALLRFSKNIKA